MRGLIGKITFGLAMSGGCLWLVFRGVQWTDVLTRLETVDSIWIAVFVLTTLLMQAFRIVRWDVLTRPFAPVTVTEQIRLSCLGLAMLVILPARLGEFARPYLLKSKTGAPMSAGLGAAVIERIFDGLTVCLAFFVTTFMLSDSYAIPPLVTAAAYGALALFSSALFVLTLATLFKERVIQFLERIGNRIWPAFTEKVAAILRAFVEASSSISEGYRFLSVLLLTLVYWSVQVLGYYAMMIGFGFELPVSASVVLACVIVLGIMIPAGPAFLGPFQGAIVVGLTIFGVSNTDAVAFGLVAYPLTILVVVLCALPFFFTSRIDLRNAIVIQQGQSA